MMIQDIAPRVFDNAFAGRRAPRDGDRVLIYEIGPGREGKILVRRRGDTWDFPGVEELAARETRLIGAPLAKGGGIYAYNPYLEFIYLFSIDGTAFYGLDGRTWSRSSLPFGCGWEDVDLFRRARPREYAFAAVTGLQLARWRSDHRFCGSCGSRMEPSQTERAYICPDCGRVVYPKICPAIIAAVTDGERILLQKYANRPHARYALTAGFAEFGETIEDTVRREIREELGLSVKNLRFYRSQPWALSDSLLFGFYCDLDGDDAVTLKRDELAEATWFDRSEMEDRSGEVSLTAEMMEQFRLGKNP